MICIQFIWSIILLTILFMAIMFNNINVIITTKTYRYARLMLVFTVANCLLDRYAQFMLLTPLKVVCYLSYHANTNLPTMLCQLINYFSHWSRTYAWSNEFGYTSRDHLHALVEGKHMVPDDVVDPFVSILHDSLRNFPG